MKKAIMRRLIENSARDEALRRWTMPYLKQEVLKMQKMDRIELIEYKRKNNLAFYKGGYVPPQGVADQLTLASR